MSDFRFAILGAGNIARTMAKTINAMPGVALYAVAARDGARAEAFAKEFGAEKAYGSYEELAADDKAELIYVSTPHSHHHAHAKLCLQHGRPVLCEKAFTLNAAEARELIALSAEKAVFLTEAMWPRYNPFMQQIAATAASGAIGDIVMVEAGLGFYGREIPRMYDPALAGGALLDLGVYPITCASMVLGGAVEKVISDVAMLETGVDATNSILLHYKNGVMARLGSSIMNWLPETWHVYGTKGALRIQGINNPPGFDVLDGSGNVTAHHDAPAQITGYEYEVAACIKAIREGRRECAEMPHAETLRVMELMDTLRGQWGMRYPAE